MENIEDGIVKSAKCEMPLVTVGLAVGLICGAELIFEIITDVFDDTPRV